MYWRGRDLGLPEAALRVDGGAIGPTFILGLHFVEARLAGQLACRRGAFSV